MRQPLHLIRYFAIASLLTILVVAGLVEYSYRRVAIATIVELGEDINSTLGRIALHAVEPVLVAYLEQVADVDPAAAPSMRAPNELAEEIRNLVARTGVARVKIYNRAGIVVFSTLSRQIGTAQADNPGFQSAMGGSVASKLVYRDTFNRFDRETHEDNLIQTYLPVRSGGIGATIGVFEVYTDINHLVPVVEAAQLAFFPIMLGLFLVLFAALVAVVWRASRLIDEQRSVITDRTRLLETLSARLMSAQEDEKKRVSTTLHEDVAQTLSALKFEVEALMLKEGREDSAAGQAITRVVGALQNAIRDIRALAMNLRPVTLDEFGLLKTLEGVIVDVGGFAPGLEISLRTAVKEQQIPRPLRIVIYRIVNDVVTAIATRTDADRVAVIIEVVDHAIELALCENASIYHAGGITEGPLGDSVALMKERTLLSGGEFGIRSAEAPGNCLVARWPIRP